MGVRGSAATTSAIGVNPVQPVRAFADASWYPDPVRKALLSRARSVQTTRESCWGTLATQAVRCRHRPVIFRPIHVIGW